MLTSGLDLIEYLYSINKGCVTNVTKFKNSISRMRTSKTYAAQRIITYMNKTPVTDNKNFLNGFSTILQYCTQQEKALWIPTNNCIKYIQYYATAHKRVMIIESWDQL